MAPGGGREEGTGPAAWASGLGWAPVAGVARCWARAPAPRFVCSSSPSYLYSLFLLLSPPFLSVDLFILSGLKGLANVGLEVNTRFVQPVLLVPALVGALFLC